MTKEQLDVRHQRNSVAARAIEAAFAASKRMIVVECGYYIVGRYAGSLSSLADDSTSAKLDA